MYVNRIDRISSILGTEDKYNGKYRLCFAKLALATLDPTPTLAPKFTILSNLNRRELAPSTLLWNRPQGACGRSLVRRLCLIPSDKPVIDDVVAAPEGWSGN